MLTWPKASTTPCWARMRLASTSSRSVVAMIGSLLTGTTRAAGSARLAELLAGVANEAIVHQALGGNRLGELESAVADVHQLLVEDEVELDLEVRVPGV